MKIESKLGEGSVFTMQFPASLNAGVPHHEARQA